MKVRVISGIVIGLLLLVVLTSGGYVLAAVLCVISLAATWELSKAFGLRDTRNVVDDGSVTKDVARGEKARHGVSGMEIVAYLGVLGLYTTIVVTDGNPDYFIGAIIAFFFAETLIYVIRFPAYHVSRLTETVFSFLYAPVLLSFLYLVRRLEGGAWFVWMPFFAWVCDTFAYFSGRLFGRHKLCPALSPKKTVEGAVGGVICTTLISFGYGAVMPYYTDYNERVIWACGLIGLSCSILSQLGDLLASGIKRDRGLKDYGQLIPGHGGIMDRFDSVLFVSPVVYVLVVYLL